MVLVNADQDQILRLISKNLETARKSRYPNACNAWLQCEHEKHMHEVHALNACVKCMRENEKKRLI